MKKIRLLLAAMLAFVFTTGVWAQTKEAYAEVSTDGTTLTFYYNANRLECKGETYDLTWDNNGPGWYEEYGSTIATATFDISFDYYYELTNIHDMFAGLSKLYTINHLEYLHTDKVTNMAGLFAECESLTSLNLSSFNTSQVTDMSYVFYGCESLRSLNLSSFNTSQVTDMSYMFYGCEYLESLHLSNFDTSQVTAMSNMFNYCKYLTSINLSSFNTSKVTDMTGLFAGCESLTSLNLSSFNTSKVTGMSQLFHNCQSLTSLDLSKFNTSQVKVMDFLFSGCKSLTSLNLSNFDTSEVTEMYQMFADCSNLKSIVCDADWNMGKMGPNNSVRMFYNCRSLVGAVSYSDSNANDVTLANPSTGYFTRQEPEPQMLVAALVPSNGEYLMFEGGDSDNNLSSNSRLVRFPKGSDLVIAPSNTFPGSVVVHLYINGEDRINDLVDGEYGDKELHLQNVAEDILVEAKYIAKQWSVPVVASAGGTIKALFTGTNGVEQVRTLLEGTVATFDDIKPGTDITFTFQPEQGYELGLVFCNYNRMDTEEVQLQTDGTYQFVLPADQVVSRKTTVVALYKKTGTNPSYDVNGDGFVTITDAVLIVNEILNQ